jgi:hypothetical protein
VAHVLAEMFAWPDGIVVGNLIASALWAAPALLHLHRKLDRYHAEQGRRHDELRVMLASMHDGYARTIAAVSERLGGA